MAERPLDRRDFNKLTAAALSGLATGSMLGCGGDKPAAPVAANPAAPTTPEKHLCRGLNECKGQGKGGQNTCRGQGRHTVADTVVAVGE
jgi:hypothetical protein